MRVYLLDKEKITKILLPNEVEGIFLMKTMQKLLS